MALDLKSLIAEVPDYPKPGISFKDLTPLLSSPEGLREVTNLFARRFKDSGVDAIVAAEARGFLFGGALAHALGAGLIPVRKPKKLPRPTIFATYELEYGTDELHMHRDAIRSGQKILIVDDVLATGGTARAMADLVTRLGGTIVSLAFVIELGFLKGRAKLTPHAVTSLVEY